MPTVTITVDNKPVKVTVELYRLTQTMREQYHKFIVIGKNVFVDTATMKPERRLAEVDQAIHKLLLRNPNVLLRDIASDLRMYSQSTKVRASPEELAEYKKYRVSLESIALREHKKKVSREINTIRLGIQAAKESIVRSTKFLEKYKDTTF